MTQRYRDQGQRIFKSGFTDLGSFFPFGVVYLILTDLADGKRWLVTWNTSIATLDGFGHISISDDLSVTKRETYVEYKMDEGPNFTNDGQYKLIVRGGRLGLSYTPFPVGQSAAASPKPYAKLSYDNVPRLIYLTNYGSVDTVHGAWTPEFKQ